MEERYIMIDIDGVLALAEQHNMQPKTFQEKRVWARELKVPYPFDKKCVDVLNDILFVTDAKLVLSSDWKFHWGLKDIDVIFRANGVICSPIDITSEYEPSTSMCYRLEENRAVQIEEYVRSREIQNFVIIDDLNLVGYLLNDHKDRFFLTKESQGLKESGLKEKIIKKLMEQ